MRWVGKVLVADLNHLDRRAYIRNPGLDLDPGAGDHEPRREFAPPLAERCCHQGLSAQQPSHHPSSRSQPALVPAMVGPP